MDVSRDIAIEASTFLKTLANENRLMVLCHLAQGEKTVSELESLVGIRQSNLSQQLARLRAEGLVTSRRNAKSVYYGLDSREAIFVIQLLYRLFMPARRFCDDHPDARDRCDAHVAFHSQPNIQPHSTGLRQHGVWGDDGAAIGTIGFPDNARNGLLQMRTIAVHISG